MTELGTALNIKKVEELLNKADSQPVDGSVCNPPDCCTGPGCCPPAAA